MRDHEEANHMFAPRYTPLSDIWGPTPPTPQPSHTRPGSSDGGTSLDIRGDTGRAAARDRRWVLTIEVPEKPVDEIEAFTEALAEFVMGYEPRTEWDVLMSASLEWTGPVWPNEDVAQRFASNLAVTESCWLFRGSLDRYGYGKFYVSGRTHQAHRFCYQLLVGPVPDGLELDHLCRVRHCVNPAHLEPVTHLENVRRGRLANFGRSYPSPRGPRMKSASERRTHCPQGHEKSGANLRVNARGDRVCRTCANAQANEGKRRKRALALAQR